MATASKTFTRALRSTPASSSFRPTAARRFAVPRQALQQASRRTYASEAPKPTEAGSEAPKPSGGSSSNTLLYGAIAAAVLAGGAYYGFNASKQGSAEQGQKGSTVFSPTKEDYQKVYNAIAKRLVDENDYDDGSYGPVLLRLGWHASGTFDAQTGTGGSNGATMRFAPEGDHGANAGLVAARHFLEPVKQAHPWISYSDLWILAAACAIQEMGGPDIPWRPGRTDRDVSFCTPDGRLPDGAKGADHLRAIFQRMGFDDREIVALSGAHALGRCHTDRSGFDGPWTFSPITLTNDYYKLLVEEKWAWKKWNGPKQYEDVASKSLMMLPTDMALIKDRSFKGWVKKYADDNDLFFRDFSNVLVKLFELGVPFKDAEGERMVLKRME
nr:cytochrome c peroxidase, mitochondrial [Quercus suber]